MASTFHNLKERSRDFIWKVLRWTIFIATVAALFLSVHFFGLRDTIGGAALVLIAALLVLIALSLGRIRQDLELIQDLIKGPPQMRTIPAADLEPGMYLYGGELVCGVTRLEDGSVIGEPERGKRDSPWVFEPEAMVDVTDRSLYNYEGGSELVSASRWKRVAESFKAGMVVPDDDA